MIILFVRSRDQVLAPFQRFIDQQHRLVCRSFMSSAHSIPWGPRNPAGELKTALISSSCIGRVSLPHRCRQLRFVQLMVAAQQHYDGRGLFRFWRRLHRHQCQRLDLVLRRNSQKFRNLFNRLLPRGVHFEQLPVSLRQAHLRPAPVWKSPSPCSPHSCNFRSSRSDLRRRACAP